MFPPTQPGLQVGLRTRATRQPGLVWEIDFLKYSNIYQTVSSQYTDSRVYVAEEEHLLLRY